MDSKFTTYLCDENSLKSAVDLGFNKVLVEEPHFSLLCERKILNEIDLIYIESIFELGKKLNPNLEIIFNLDIIAHNNDIEKVKVFISQLQKIGYGGIRVQDIGIANIIHNHFPELTLEINTVTGNYNSKAISFLENSFKPQLRTIVLSRDIPYDNIVKISEKSILQNEILIHGPIILFYSKRHLIVESNFMDQSTNYNDQYELFLQEKMHPDDWFPFINNTHGSFMFYSKIFCLINRIQDIIKTNISNFLFDFRRQPLDTMKTVVTEFKKLIVKTKSCSNTTDHSNNSYKIIESCYPQGLTEGFFVKNTTDCNIKPMNNDNKPIAKVLGVIKEKLIAVETISPFNLNDTLIIKTPEGKAFSYTPGFIKTIEGDNLTSIIQDKLVILDWHKGVTPESLIYLDNKLL
ncbi:MAG: U32 family peptidase [Spirochaetota bacterium]|nr:U32 family peptidase [Spirochaetota bacterium]